MDRDKASIVCLPVELLVYVARDLEYEDDLSAFSRTCRRIHGAVISILYDRVKNDPVILNWAAEKGRVGTVKYLLDAGTDPNLPQLSHFPRIFIASQLIEAQDLNIELLEMITLTDRKDGNCKDDGTMINYASLEDELLNYEDYPEYDQLGDGDSSDESEADSEEEEDHIDDEPGENPLSGDRSFPTRNYWTPLHAAAKYGFIEIVKLLLDYGADINALARGYCGCSYPVDSLPKFNKTPVVPLWTPLHTAICSGNEHIACFLLWRGASTFVSTRGVGSKLERVTALHSACFSGCAHVYQYLIGERYQTDINCEDHLGMTPMSYAYYAAQWDSIHWLAKNGANLNARIGMFTLVKHACFYSRFYEARRLLELGADTEYSCPQPLNRQEMPVLHCCCQQPYVGDEGHIQMPRRASKQVSPRNCVIRTLMEYDQRIKGSLETQCYGYGTPLLEAARFHLSSTVELLLAAGADRSARCVRARSALITACAAVIESPTGELLRVVESLLPEASTDDCVEAMRGLCLNPARLEDKVEVARLLLVQCDISNSLERVIRTEVLQPALVYGNCELAELLFQYGLRYPRPDEFRFIFESVIQMDNVTGLEYLIKSFPESAVALINDGQLLLDALRAPRGRCARLLIKAEAPIAYRNGNGESCMMRAVSRKSTYLAKMLLARGANPEERINGRRRVLHIPVRNRNTKMIQLLLDNGADSKCEYPPLSVQECTLETTCLEKARCFVSI